ncbi:AzlC family ABC transporter permease [Halomonas sp. McH1-25]|uniref:AzlC family ABC transporter permease n=1 Tax=unclassified Halomonas TaxID=2609666 RepID=UPI001EF4580B|nr:MULTISPECIES: AzlC family ABC transporter permease [unclassified Halomonas]MCG7600792.1 AzlC family ABC transporter permease [Halomonas sp. McH1-25]MCP1342757.1 AzlC family ABC transporter permease [Halomonas sp. FL8]MCP1361062.1 AzlC family ABC transporter permease [Halomonas sp. BBD45]
MKAFFQGLADSASIGVGYLPIAFSFGLTALQAGLSPASTLLISVTVFAGASQFVLITLLTSGAGLIGTLGTVLLMNARHLFYGPALMPRLASEGRQLPSPLLAFGLTDEVFAAASSRLERIAPSSRHAWYLGLQTGAYLTWVLGTLLGVTLGKHVGTLPGVIEDTLSFVLPALFFALLLEIGVKAWAGTILITALATALLMMVLPSHHALALGLLTGAALSAKRRRTCSQAST